MQRSGARFRSGWTMGLAAMFALVALAGCSASSHATARPPQQAAQQTAAAAPAQTGCPPPARTTSGLAPVTFTNQKGVQSTITIEIADTPQLQELGLMSRPGMADDQGMLFVFAEDTNEGFWMHCTLIPLQIAFIDAYGTIVDIQSMQALTDDVHNPAKYYRYTVEANAGWFDRQGLQPGDSAALGQALAQSSH